MSDLYLKSKHLSQASNIEEGGRRGNYLLPSPHLSPLHLSPPVLWPFVLCTWKSVNKFLIRYIIVLHSLIKMHAKVVLCFAYNRFTHENATVNLHQETMQQFHPLITCVVSDCNKTARPLQYSIISHSYSCIQYPGNRLKKQGYHAEQHFVIFHTHFNSHQVLWIVNVLQRLQVSSPFHRWDKESYLKIVSLNILSFRRHTGDNCSHWLLYWFSSREKWLGRSWVKLIAVFSATVILHCIHTASRSSQGVQKIAVAVYSYEREENVCGWGVSKCHHCTLE